MTAVSAGIALSARSEEYGYEPHFTMAPPCIVG